MVEQEHNLKKIAKPPFPVASTYEYLSYRSRAYSTFSPLPLSRNKSNRFLAHVRVDRRQGTIRLYYYHTADSSSFKERRPLLPKTTPGGGLGAREACRACVETPEADVKMNARTLSGSHPLQGVWGSASQLPILVLRPCRSLPRWVRAWKSQQCAVPSAVRFLLLLRSKSESAIWNEQKRVTSVCAVLLLRRDRPRTMYVVFVLSCFVIASFALLLNSCLV